MMAGPPARILVVDDEVSMTDTVGGVLRDEGFDVLLAGTGRAAIATATSSWPDLVVLDVMLPDLDGFEVIRRLRLDGWEVPVLFLTARDAVEDRVAGLRMGGDDYVTKPFSLDEVVERVSAILRRTCADIGDDGVLRVGDVVLNGETHEVWRAGIPVHLTATEHKLLRYLMRNTRRVLSKSQILDAVWDHGFEVDDNVVETFVSYLRKKLHRLGPPVIHTVRLVGYTYRPASE
jgi:two-component system OmpR family response regulator